MQATTRSFDNARTGSNINETILTPQNVGKLRFLRSLQLDAGDDKRLEAQPLYLKNVKMIDGTVHRGVVFVCTMANNVYAFDVDTGNKIWGPIELGPGKPINPGPDKHHGMVIPTQPKPATELDLYGINDLWGILSTPVIDPEDGTLYIVNWSSPDGTRVKAVHTLHALRSADGSEVGKGVTLQAVSSVNPEAIWHSPDQKQRAALLLVNVKNGNGPAVKTLFIASGKFGERIKIGKRNPSGWILAYDVGSMTQTASWCTTPKIGGGGIWHAGQGPCAGEDGTIFVTTSNGNWEQPNAAETPIDISESFVALRYSPPSPPKAASLTVGDWFTPFLDDDRRGPIKGAQTPQDGYDFTDQDLGSAGPILPMGTSLLSGCGKDGVLYLFNSGQLGHKRVDPNKATLADNPSLLNAIFFTYFPGPNVSPLANLDVFRADGKTHHLHGSPVSWVSAAHGPMLFVWGENAALRAWALQNDGTINFLAQSHETASAFSARFDAMPGGMCCLTANGTNDGILWATVPIKTPGKDEGDANKEHVVGVLRAYDASNFSAGANDDGTARVNLLFDSMQAGSPPFTFSKFCPPVVVDGVALVATYDGCVNVYGL